MANYIIIGGDGKEYGPVTDADVRQWIFEGRLSGQTQTKAESDAEFRPLAAFPEFAAALGAGAPPTISPLKSSASAAFLERDYELDLFGCIGRGWHLLKENFSVLFVGPLLYFLIQCGIGTFSNLPWIGPLFSLGNLVISGPFVAGLFYLFIRVNRGEPGRVGDIFAGFTRGFGQLFLGFLAQAVLVGLCLTPFVVILIVRLMPILQQLNPHEPLNPDKEMELLKSMAPVFIGSLPWLFVCAIPATYLSVCLKFTLPIIIDKQVNFWTAIKTSWRMVNKHWWQVFGLILLISLLNIAGAFACLVGLLFTAPIGFGALMSAYETIFGEQKD